MSGNPLRRAEQLEQDRLARSAYHEHHEHHDHSGLGDLDAGSLRELAYRLAGGVEEVPWWPDSLERVLQQARALDWPTQLSGIEDQATELAGGQFYDNLQAHEAGHHRAQWLRALAEHAGAALRAAITGGDDWRPLWALLYAWP